MVNANDIWPGNLKILLLLYRLNACLRCRRRRRWAIASFMRKECKRNAEDVDVFRIEQPRFSVHLIGRAAQAASNHLLTQQLARESPQPHDVRAALAIR